MTQIENAWGAAPGAGYEALAATFRPIFAEIARQAPKRDLERHLPHDAIRSLKEAGFGAVRLPTAHGGRGASLPQFFNLLIELSAADSNVTQALRAHFGYAEDILNSKDAERRSLWFGRIAGGETAGSAWSEIGAAATLDRFSTNVAEKDGRLLLNGAKYYTTGSLFADWIDVGASDANGEGIAVAVRRDAEGVEVVDDWDGFGQTLTASGTTTFRNVAVEPEDIVVDDERFKYSSAFYQIVHLATLAGIGRAITTDVAKAVAERRRTYTHAAASRSSEDPQVLQVVGRIRAAAYAASAITLQAASSLERAYEAHFIDDPEAEEKANAIAELEAAQAQTVVSDLILEASTLLFDALGASATKKPAGLDRHWRNARTLASHNPRIYKHRIIGDFAVNGTPPPYQWRIGASAG
ncbi:Dibenzothiophene desulfurization enzyme C [Ensifer adhaerens]|uniref:Alkylation response protein AidB-like acyl-CoA dehydrogenase n=1 Tax=Ensifer adhaerens TaxID=106592 RepID=A0ACC5T549_ENSAD|nr:acyl-CoA dehydrogenase family protein [Ensifer adhaerens]MBP1876255.1 alkylation response protein AidB-like acyl-CoA dehydrogenase [Ensifer adhaerens]NRP22064.1 Dibenzothiophene desulfurization enzyme C [Ensifer adhaerens]